MSVYDSYYHVPVFQPVQLPPPPADGTYNIDLLEGKYAVLEAVDGDVYVVEENVTMQPYDDPITSDPLYEKPITPDIPPKKPITIAPHKTPEKPTSSVLYFNPRRPDILETISFDYEKHRNKGHVYTDLTPWKCDFCPATVTVQRRRGPGGMNTLCNKCGIVWSKSIPTISPDQAPAGFSKKRRNSKNVNEARPSKCLESNLKKV